MHPVLKQHWLALMLIVLTLGCSKPAKQEDTFAGLSRQGTDKSKTPQQTEKALSQVLPGYKIAFPEDHQSHPTFAVEWWYVTANLTDHNNQHYALQWTLFRFASGNQVTPWSNAQQYMGHVSLRDGTSAWFEERFARGGVGNAGVSSSPFTAFIDNWQWRSESATLFPSSITLFIQNDVSAELSLNAHKPFLLHDEQGYSRKLRDSSQASYYYSQPHISVEGELNLPAGPVKVTGQAWYDHEWTSEYLNPQAIGWDWFSIHLDGGAKLMLFRMRHSQVEDFWSGTFISEQGEVSPLSEQDIVARVVTQQEVAGRNLPLNWSIQLPNHKIDIQISPLQIEQWNAGTFSYYEGGTKVSGSHSGVGFMELTGY
jgi:predicted secreted hydrolase